MSPATPQPPSHWRGDKQPRPTPVPAQDEVDDDATPPDGLRIKVKAPEQVQAREVERS